MTLSRSTPLRRAGRIAAKPTRPRKWLCSHCRTKNDPGKRKCGTCGIGRATKRTSLKARCDSLARELCRLLAKGLCARCGGPGSDWMHRWPRRHHAMRWSMDNCDFGCRKCHTYLDTHPHAKLMWLINRGVDVAGIERAANSNWDKSYTRVLADLQRQLAALKSTSALAEKEGE